MNSDLKQDFFLAAQRNKKTGPINWFDSFPIHTAYLQITLYWYLASATNSHKQNSIKYFFIIPDEYSMPLNKYSYSHAKHFLNNPEKTPNHMSFKGEVYEASFYEHKVDAYRNDNFTKNCHLVAKGPYTPKAEKFVITGFFCDPKGSIIYNSNKISLAEFDCLEISNDSIFFYECTLTQKPEGLRTLQKEAERKFTLLKKLFPSRKIFCTIVSDNETTLKRFNNQENFKTLHFPFPEVDIFYLAKKSKRNATPPLKNMRSANSINNLISNFDYHKEVEQLSLTLRDSSLFSIEKKIMDSNGLFERLYWGSIPAGEHIKSREKINSNHVIISINFSRVDHPVLRYYFFDKKNGAPYEVGNPSKLLNKFKNSRAELIFLRNKLPVRRLADLRKLENEILEWHERGLHHKNE